VLRYNFFDIHSEFYEDPDFMNSFLDVIKYKVRGDIVTPSSSFSFLPVEKNIYIREGLVPIRQHIYKETCLEYVYFNLFKCNTYFTTKISKYWPCILNENGKLSKLSEIIIQIKKETYPKSANKR
jgi:hypothetical protein